MKLKTFKTEPKSRIEAINRAIYLQEILCKEFRGKFKICVFENLGWHYSVQCGTLDINYSIPSGKYWVMVSDNKEKLGVGSYPFHISGGFQSKNPILAVKKAMANMKQQVERLASVYKYNKQLFTKR